MARKSEASSDAPAPPPPSSSAASPSRVTKPRAERFTSRNTRLRSRGMEHLQSMVNDAKNDIVRESAIPYNPITAAVCKGKGKAKVVQEPVDVDMGTPQDMPGVAGEDDADTVFDMADKPFPIMELPTEIRLEIYRACLTRPYNILLSKREQPQRDDPDDADKFNILSDSQSDAEQTDDDSQLPKVPKYQRLVPRPSGATTSGSSISRRQSAVARGSTSRSSRPTRILSSRSTAGSSANNSNSSGNAQPGQWTAITGAPATTNNNSSNGVTFRPAASGPVRRNGNSRSTMLAVTEPPRNQSADPLIVNILQASKEVYKEARSILYSENFFTLDLNTAMGTLACLHQRSRRQIKHVELEVPTYNEILERFQETVRLSLRYCSGLKKFVIHMPFTLPGADGSGTTGNTTVYANGFDILRWLPQECDMVLKGNICVEIETVVNKHLHLAKTLDKLAYARRQLISNDTGPSSITHMS